MFTLIKHVLLLAEHIWSFYYLVFELMCRRMDSYYKRVLAIKVALAASFVLGHVYAY